MATTGGTTLANPFLKSTGTGTTELDLEGLGNALTQTAERVSKPIIGSIPSEEEAATALGLSKMQQRSLKAGQSTNGASDMLQVQSARQNALAQAQALQTQATNQSEALKAKGAVVQDSVQRLQALQTTMAGASSKAAEAWQLAGEKADEGVQAANQRMSEVVGRLDKMVNDVTSGLDFAKAHAIQATAMGTLNAMTEAERDVVSQFGKSSPEHMDFVARKTASLQQSISSIHDKYMELAVSAKTTMAATWASAATTMATLVNYQEKGAVDVAVAAAQALPLYELQTAQLNMQIEQYKTLGLNDLVDSMSGAAVLRYDSLPLAQLIGELAAARKAEQNAQVKAWSASGGSWQTGGNTLATSKRSA